MKMTIRKFFSKMQMSSDIECASIRVRNLILTELTRDDLVKEIYNGTGECIIETFRIAYGQIVIYVKVAPYDRP